MSAEAVVLVCPFCFSGVLPKALFLCPRCTRPHHVDCFELEGGCAVLGCGGELAIEPPEDGGPLESQPAAATSLPLGMTASRSHQPGRRLVVGVALSGALALGTASWAIASTSTATDASVVRGSASDPTNAGTPSISASDSSDKRWVAGPVHLDYLDYGTTESDSVRRLQWVLKQEGYSIRVTGNYLSETDGVVREWQSDVGDIPDEAGQSSVGSRQAERLFAPYSGIRVS